MVKGYCDLHTHSTASDGMTPPGMLGMEAKQAGLAAVALTDHDTTEGLPEAAAGCEKAGVEFVPGIEISADPFAVLPGCKSVNGELIEFGTLHVLGMFVRHDDEKLLAIHERMCHARDSRNPAIVARLQELGLRIEYEEVLMLAAEQGTKIIGRPHIGQVMIEKGYVKSMHDAFNRYIGQGRPAYVRRDRLEPGEALEAIHHAGGLAVMAHPKQLKAPDADTLELFVRKLADMGLDGIETVHTDHTPAQVKQYEKLAEKFGLVTTGGSDYHGVRKPIALGSQQVSMEVYERLKEVCEAKRV